MRKVVMWNMVTADGFFAGPEGDLGWFVFDKDLEKYIHETQDEADALIFGRVTYQMMAAYWPSERGTIADYMNSIKKLVVSRTLESADWNNTTLVKDNVAQKISKLKRQEGSDIRLIGSADLAASLIEHDLIDEYRLGINPVILGAGTRLFKGNSGKLKLRLSESKMLKSGVVILHYARERN